MIETITVVTDDDGRDIKMPEQCVACGKQASNEARLSNGSQPSHTVAGMSRPLKLKPEKDSRVARRFRARVAFPLCLECGEVALKKKMHEAISPDWKYLERVGYFMVMIYIFSSNMIHSEGITASLGFAIIAVCVTVLGWVLPPLLELYNRRRHPLSGAEIARLAVIDKAVALRVGVAEVRQHPDESLVVAQLDFSDDAFAQEFKKANAEQLGNPPFWKERFE